MQGRSLNSTMVRLKLKQNLVCWNEQRGGLNSTMVRLKLWLNASIKMIQKSSQFHYGSIKTKEIEGTEYLVFSLNSTMV